MMWTDERVELLKRLWGEGLSASQIASELGGVTRNAVIGKVHRLGLAGRAKAPTAATARPRKPARPAVVATARPTAVVRGNVALAPIEPMLEPIVAVEPVPAPTLDIVIPFSTRIGIMDLRESTCRWPIGDPGRDDFGFCGARSGSGTPYCAKHSAIAYQPLSERRRERKLVVS